MRSKHTPILYFTLAVDQCSNTLHNNKQTIIMSPVRWCSIESALHTHNIILATRRPGYSTVSNRYNMVSLQAPVRQKPAVLIPSIVVGKRAAPPCPHQPRPVPVRIDGSPRRSGGTNTRIPLCLTHMPARAHHRHHYTNPCRCSSRTYTYLLTYLL